MPPTAQKLREAEEFVENLRPVRGNADLLEAMRWALEPTDADTVYLLTSGWPKRTDVNYILADLRARNVREVPIHIIGVNCEPQMELSLRRLAEQNSGSFRQKRFDLSAKVLAEKALESATSSRSRPARLHEDDERLTIGGQIDIIEVMLQEAEVHTIDWLEEQKCANRLLFSSASQQAVPDCDQARQAAKRVVLTHLCREKTLPRLQDMLEGRGKQDDDRRPIRRGSTQPAQKATLPRPDSAGRSSGYPVKAAQYGGAAEQTARRLSPANPWDRVTSGPIKVSQLCRNLPGKR